MKKNIMIARAPEEQAPERESESTGSLNSALVALESDRETHLRELGELRSELLEQPETDVEEADPEVPEQAKTLALVHQIEEHVAEIEQALEAAREGTYGTCERCGQAIDPERLRAVPETRLCVRCKSQLEKRAPRHRRRI